MLGGTVSLQLLSSHNKQLKAAHQPQLSALGYLLASSCLPSCWNIYDFIMTYFLPASTISDRLQLKIGHVLQTHPPVLNNGKKIDEMKRRDAFYD